MSFKKELSFLIKFSGSRYTCPICSKNSRKLLPTGQDLPILHTKHVVGGGLRNAACPYCFSSDRERLVFLYLERENLLSSASCKPKVLHVAPERRLTNYLAKVDTIEYICGDKFTEGYSYPKYTVDMDLREMPFEENSIDLIICNHVLEHIEEDRKAMKEIFRVLKPNGRAILQVPISLNTEETHEDFTVSDPKKREQLFGQFDHVRIYGQDYSKRLESVGLKVEKHELASAFPMAGLNPEELLYVAVKPL